MKKYLMFPGIICILLSGFASKQTTESLYEIRTYGVKINVTDMKQALDFYTNKLGFIVEDGNPDSNMVFLKESKEKEKIVLNRVNNLLPERIRDNTVSFTLQVNDLDSTIVSIKNKGIDLGDYQPRKEGVGYAIFINDPFSTRISLMHQTIVKVPWFQEPLVYNYGFLISDMVKARDFYCNKLGFTARSEKYLPLDLPLGHSDKTFAFMLHYREGVKDVLYHSANDEHVVVLFRTNDLAAAIKDLKEKGVTFVQAGIQKSSLGNYISFYDPFGYVSELVEIK